MYVSMSRFCTYISCLSCHHKVSELKHYIVVSSTAPNFRTEVQRSTTRGNPVTGQEQTESSGALCQGGRSGGGEGGTLLSAGEIQTQV